MYVVFPDHFIFYPNSVMCYYVLLLVRQQVCIVVCVYDIMTCPYHIHLLLLMFDLHSSLT